MKARRIARALASAGALAVFAAAPADARVKHVWVAAVPNSWNVAPSGHDPISGEEVDPGRGDLRHRRLPALHPALAQAAARTRRARARTGSLIPGPLIRARVGDRLRIHFKNMDSLREDPHSMHFHGVHYKPSSDGAFVPGFSGKDGNVKFGRKYTYRLTVGPRLGRRVALPRPLAVDGGLDPRRHVRDALAPRPPRAAARSRVPGRVLAVRHGLHDDQRPRVRRQHAGLPRAASASACSGT